MEHHTEWEERIKKEFWKTFAEKFSVSQEFLFEEINEWWLEKVTHAKVETVKEILQMQVKIEKKDKGDYPKEYAYIIDPIRIKLYASENNIIINDTNI